MSYFQGNSIFWIEVEKIKPNPYQPRKEFDEEKLKSLAESVRQYGVLQPLVVTRREVEKPDGGISVEYELIAGERRLRASKLANLTQVPVIIKSGEEDSLLKLELAIIENIQREDLNPIDRALAFERLVEEFGFKHGEVGKKVGKSREYVSNTLRLLTLPEELKQAVATQRMSEGHARTLMMLNDRPEEQMTVFKEIIYKSLTVRETEAIARRIAHDKVRKKSTAMNPEIVELEDKLSESLGTRVQIETRENGGKIMIDFFSPDDIRNIIALVTSSGEGEVESYDMLSRFIESQKAETGEGSQNDAVAESAPLHTSHHFAESDSAKENFTENFHTERSSGSYEQNQNVDQRQSFAYDNQGQPEPEYFAHVDPVQNLTPQPQLSPERDHAQDSASSFTERDHSSQFYRQEEAPSPSSFPHYEDFEFPQAHADNAVENSAEEKSDDEDSDDLYSVSNFTI